MDKAGDFLLLSPVESGGGSKKDRDRKKHDNRKRKRDHDSNQDNSHSAKRFSEFHRSISQSSSYLPSPWRDLSSNVDEKKHTFQSPMMMLHSEILEFEKLMQPTRDEMIVSKQALQKVVLVILTYFPDVKIESFGSRANNVALPSSDWDIVLFNLPNIDAFDGSLTSPKERKRNKASNNSSSNISSINSRNNTSKFMKRLASHLKDEDVTNYVEIIESARVPILKFKEKVSNITIDISFQAESGILTREYISNIVSIYPFLRPLILLLKYYLSQRNLNDTYNGGIGSFCLTLMVVHVAQLVMQLGGYERLLDGSSKHENSNLNDLNLGVLLVAFLEEFGYNLNYKDIGISVKGDIGCYYKKISKNFFDPSRPFLLSIENPLDHELDVGKNSWNIIQVKKAFMFSHTRLSKAIRSFLNVSKNDKKNSGEVKSILSQVIFPDAFLTARIKEMKLISSAENEKQVLVSRAIASNVPNDARKVEKSHIPSELKEKKDNDDVEVALEEAKSILESSGVQIRKPRLLADILTRKARNVNEMVNAHLDSWY
jgi:non-canonical poly(A) RNA polymerase PAPD5/7